VDDSGNTVWYYVSSPICGGDFQQQPDGSFTIAVVDPTHAITGLNETLTVYRQIDVLGNTLNTWSALDVPGVQIAATDSHDIRIQPNGDALLYGLVEQTMDLTQEGGQPGTNVVGNIFERVTREGKVSFSWNTFDHLDVANIDPACAKVASSPVDFTHGNAIDVLDDGNYLLGFRDLSQLVKIDATTGEVIWKLGGADSTFTFMNDPLGGFSCQHGGRELPNGDILMLDDGNGHSPKQSRAVEYKLDTNARTATLVWSSEDSPAMFTQILGYAQRLTNGNTLITYGMTGNVQEVDENGNVLWTLTDPVNGEVDFGIYRAYRMDSISPLALTGG
jgi:outer membrane protein assembly factor BamB